MRNLKRSLSIILITATVATSLPFSVFAEESTGQDDVQEVVEETDQETVQAVGNGEQETVKDVQNDNSENTEKDLNEKNLDLIDAFIQEQFDQIQTEVTFDGGDGTEEDPYLISTAKQLDKVRDNLTACYKLTADIIFSDEDFAAGGDFYNDGKGWEPIGENRTTMFSGTFDGAGKKISNLYIDASLSYAGLFGCSGGTIKNLGVVDSEITISSSGSVQAGGITGENDGSIINCYNSLRKYQIQSSKKADFIDKPNLL